MSDRLIWIDTETTGLDTSTALLLEVACVITDGNLRPLAAYTEVFGHPVAALNMDDVVLAMHQSSGLLDEVARVYEGGRYPEGLLSFLQWHTPPGECPLAGSTVSFDRAVLRENTPLAEAHAIYRNVDVSTVKDLVKRWRPEVYAARPQGTKAHRALDDILHSIEELAYYRRALGLL